MRKIFAFLLVVVMAVGMAACAQTPETAEPTVPVTMAPPEPVRKNVHILLPEAMASQTMELANILASVGDFDGSTATYADAQEQTQLLTEIAAQSKGNGSDVVVTMPLTEDVDAVFAQLLEADVAYALADLIPADAKTASVANVYYDQHQIGAAVAAYLTEKGMTPNDKVVILQGVTKAEAQRTEGFQLYLQGKLTCDGAAVETPWESLDTIIYSDMQGTTQDSAKAYFETHLSEAEHADVKYIVAWDDAYALGVLDALEGENISTANKERFLGGSPILIGCGGNGAMQDVLAGTSAYTSVASFGEIRTVLYSQDLLKIATQAMVDHLTGAVVEQDQPQPITWATAENASVPSIEG